MKLNKKITFFSGIALLAACASATDFSVNLSNTDSASKGSVYGVEINNDGILLVSQAQSSEKRDYKLDNPKEVSVGKVIKYSGSAPWQFVSTPAVKKIEITEGEQVNISCKDGECSLQ